MTSDKRLAPRASAIDLWKPAASELDPLALAQILAMIGAIQRQELPIELITAYEVALAPFETMDAVRGFKVAVGVEKFLTPAAVAEHCRTARDARLEIERQAEEQARAKEAAAQVEAQAAEAAARAKARQELIASWAPAEASANAAEMLSRLLTLAELEASHLVFALRRSKAAWSPEGALVLSGLEVQVATWLSYFRPRLEAMAGKAAGHSVRVVLEEAA